MAIKISWPGVLAVAIVYVIISQLVFMLGAFADMAYYMDPAYLSVWSKLMMPTAGPPPIEFTAISAVLSFVSSLLFALVYVVVKGSVPGKGWKNKGLMYGFLVFLIAGIPSTFSLLLLINLPVGLVLSWMLQGFVAYLLAGLVAAKLLK
jgi:hypothetical protein